MGHVEEEINKTPKMNRIVFLDGNCLLCNKSVNFMAKADSSHSLYFAPAEGKTYNALIKNDYLKSVDSIILYLNGRVYIKTEALIRILIIMGERYKKVAKVISFFPLPIRDLFYDLVAKTRYFFFGRVTHCSFINRPSKEKLLP